MYADLEEEALKRRKSAVSHSKRGHSEISSRRERSPDSAASSISRSVSRSLSPQPRRSNGRLQKRDVTNSRSPVGGSDRSGKGLNAEERERELQEKLRKRALMSKRRKRSDSSPPLSRSHSRDSTDQRRSEQRRERRRGDLLDRKDHNQESRTSRSHHRGNNYTPSPVSSQSRSRSPGRRRIESSASRREGSRRMSLVDHDDEYYQRRRKLPDRSEDGYDDPSVYRRDRDHRYEPHYDPYYDRRNNGRGGGGGYYGPPRRGPDRYPPPGDYYDRPAHRFRHSRSPSPPPAPPARRRRSESKAKTPDPDDYELRSVFCSQLAARLGQRDLGEFFEDKLGEGTVRDVRIVTDKNTGRSKG